MALGRGFGEALERASHVAPPRRADSERGTQRGSKYAPGLACALLALDSWSRSARAAVSRPQPSKLKPAGGTSARTRAPRVELETKPRKTVAGVWCVVSALQSSLTPELGVGLVMSRSKQSRFRVAGVLLQLGSHLSSPPQTLSWTCNPFTGQLQVSPAGSPQGSQLPLTHCKKLCAGPQGSLLSPPSSASS